MRLDWSTLALQTANVLVLVWLLQHFLFKPVMEIIARRRDQAEQVLADAAVKATQLLERETEIARQKQAMQADAEHIRAAAQVSAEATRASIIQEAQRKANEKLKQAAATIDIERAEMESQLKDAAAKLAVAIAERLLTGVPPAPATAAMITRFEQSLATLPADQVAELSQADAGLEVVTAVPVEGDERARLSNALGRLLVPLPPLSFSVDPAIIAGIEVRGPHTVIRSNWRADLERVARALSHKEEHVEPALA